MMKRFSCGDIFPGCDATLEGETEESILQQIAIHARDAHGMEDVPPEVVDQVRAGTHDAGT